MGCRQTVYLDLPGGRCVSDLGKARPGTLKRRGWVVLGPLPPSGKPRPMVAHGTHDAHDGIRIREGWLSEEDQAAMLAFWVGSDKGGRT